MSSTLPANRLSFLYVSQKQKARITGLYSLLATVEQCLYSTSDQQVSRAKLGWWLEELHAARRGSGTHPLSQLLTGCGALSAWTEASLTRIFELALYRVDAAGLATESDLLALCESLGALHLELECALHDEVIPNQHITRPLIAVNGIMQLMRESFWAKRANFFWVPLTLCAQLNLQRQKIGDDSGHDSNQKWVVAITQLILGIPGPEEIGYKVLQARSIAGIQDNHHWLLFSLLQRRQLLRMSQSLSKAGSIRNLPSMISQISCLDSWVSWRIARLLNSVNQQ